MQAQSKAGLTAYVGAARPNEASPLMRKLEGHGVKITYDWTREAGDYQGHAEAFAALRAKGLRDADVVVVLAPGGMFELGFAVGCGKPIVAIKVNEDAFELAMETIQLYHPLVHRMPPGGDVFGHVKAAYSKWVAVLDACRVPRK